MAGKYDGLSVYKGGGWPVPRVPHNRLLLLGDNGEVHRAARPMHGRHVLDRRRGSAVRQPSRRRSLRGRPVL